MVEIVLKVTDAVMDPETVEDRGGGVLEDEGADAFEVTDKAAGETESVFEAENKDTVEATGAYDEKSKLAVEVTDVAEGTGEDMQNRVTRIFSDGVESEDRVFEVEGMVESAVKGSYEDFDSEPGLKTFFSC